MVDYLDTNILLSIIKFNTRDADYHHVLQKCLYDSKSIRIPQIVIGEAVSCIIHDTSNVVDRMNHLNRLNDKLNEFAHMPNVFPPVTDKIIKISQDLHNISSNIKNMDSLILAQAIDDSESIHFFTEDKELHIFEIKKYMEELVNKNQRRELLLIPANFSMENF